ncbi:hypothetical protein [Paenibacillus maysiensis]|uniref:hypothetical protein n=1 Tax=Paenibacillus maysiensis TaxID=1155954 RepID=UPI0004726A79|nr:hypothetical protein [Paenibacillus maysiensis]
MGTKFSAQTGVTGGTDAVSAPIANLLGTRLGKLQLGLAVVDMIPVLGVSVPMAAAAVAIAGARPLTGRTRPVRPRGLSASGLLEQ